MNKLIEELKILLKETIHHYLKHLENKWQKYFLIYQELIQQTFKFFHNMHDSSQ
jgi:hypothetical protein